MSEKLKYGWEKLKEKLYKLCQKQKSARGLSSVSKKNNETHCKQNQTFSLTCVPKILVFILH